MSTESEIVCATAEAVTALIDHVRESGDRDDPAILQRIGALATSLAATQALADAGDLTAAALFARQVIRAIAHDFPGSALPPLNLVEERRAYRAIATGLLAEPVAA